MIFTEKDKMIFEILGRKQIAADDGDKKVIFQEKRIGWRLGTSTWHSGLRYLDHEGMDSTLISLVERLGVGGSEMSAKKVLMLDHQRMGHPSFNV
jgi:hypothetical protein